jgi:Holliday junction resolvase
VKRRNYANGANAERRIKRELEARGAFVVRAAGSHGCADLVALWPHDGFSMTEPWLLQIKRGSGRATAEEREALKKAARRYGAAAQIVTVRPRKPDAWECIA